VLDDSQLSFYSSKAAAGILSEDCDLIGLTPSCSVRHTHQRNTFAVEHSQDEEGTQGGASGGGGATVLMARSDKDMQEWLVALDAHIAAAAR